MDKLNPLWCTNQISLQWNIIEQIIWAFTIGFAWSCNIKFGQIHNLDDSAQFTKINSKFTCFRQNNENSRKTPNGHSFSSAYNPILLGALEENIINVEFADSQTWAAQTQSWISLFLFPSIVWDCIGTGDTDTGCAMATRMAHNKVPRLPILESVKLAAYWHTGTRSDGQEEAGYLSSHLCYKSGSFKSPPISHLARDPNCPRC